MNEVIQKIVSQESTTENLMDLTKENQQRIESLNEQKTQSKAHVEEIKYSGPGGGHKRKMIDDHEGHLAISIARVERCRTKYERLARLLIAARAGVRHLQDKLESVREEAGGKACQLTDETIVRVMSENEKMMIELLARIRIAVDDVLVVDTSRQEVSDEMDGTELLRVRPYNQRIDLPLVDEDWDDRDVLKDSDLLKGELDDELTRDKVKKASSQILMAQDKKKAKQKVTSKVG